MEARRAGYGSDGVKSAAVIQFTRALPVSNAAALSGYGEAGIERYIFVATLDQKTSEVCAELDGQSFLRSEAKAGTNLPPMHPFCRSTTIADFREDTLKIWSAAQRIRTGILLPFPRI